MRTNQLPVRDLGAIAAPAIGYGAMVLSSDLYGPIDDAGGLAALRHALDAGASLVDTSDYYGEGHNESLVGRAIAGRRDEVIVATKFGLDIPHGVEPHRFRVGFAFRELAVNADPRYVRGYAERSLRRLGTDRIDLYYLHFPDPQVPIEETTGAVAELVADGVVRHVGMSNVTAEQLRRAHAVSRVAAVQVEWSMWKPIPADLLATAKELGVGIVAWSPLGAGFLTGAVTSLGVDDFRHNHPRFQGDNLMGNNDRYAPVRQLAEKLGITPAQLALAWLLHQDPTVVPIPGSRTPSHIDENLDAARVVLTRDTLATITRLLVGAAPVGGALL